MTRSRENADGGLVLIGTASPSSASSVSFTNLTVGKRYRILLNVKSDTAGAQSLYIKFRENSTDKSTSYYGGSFGVNEAPTSVSSGFNNVSVVDFGLLSHTVLTSVSLDLYVISLSNGHAHGTFWNGRSSQIRTIGFDNNGMSNFNGFSIYPSANGITGSIKLYEYR